MVNWKTELTSCGETLGLVDIKRDIFQGHSLSSLIFTICMVPLIKNLQDAKAGYTLGDFKANHLFFMDDLKVYGLIRSRKWRINLNACIANMFDRELTYTNILYYINMSVLPRSRQLLFSI